MKYLLPEEHKALVRKIREQKDELTKKEWGLYSCKVDFTVDELREFQDYIDWHCYYVYCSSKRLTNEQLLEFKEKHSDWCLIFEYRFLGEKLLRRFWDMLAFDSKFSWDYVFRKQNVSKQFRHRYNWILKKYDDKK